MAQGKSTIIRLTWNRFRGALVMLAKSESGGRAMLLFGLLLVMMLGTNGLNVVNSYVGRDFMSSIEQRSMDNFVHYAWLYIAVFAASTVVVVFMRFIEERLGLLWREQLTRRMVDAYMTRRTYYRLDTAIGVANPDQRIAEDVKAFTSTTLSFTLMLLNGSLQVISFSGVLWSISPHLFGVAVAYASFGTLMTVWLGRPLIRMNYNQFDMEANFRADLIHVRENSESIALAHREGRFKIRLNKRLDALARNYRRIIGVHRNLGFFTTGYNYLIQIIPALIVAPLFIRGGVEFGVITQSAMAFSTLLGAFSLIVTQFQSISAFTAVTARLYAMSDAVDKANARQDCAMEGDGKPGRVAYEGVTLESPDNSHLLVENLNLEILPGERWLVTCADDATKVALFRATAGVWPCGGGMIQRPGLDEILFLPERPYLPPGTLREVLLRTGAEDRVPDDAIMGILAQLDVDVVARAGGLDKEQDWDDMLSIGEQHMLSVARIMLAKPEFVYLDRPGSALSRSQISKALDLIKGQGIGVVVLAKDGESQLRYDGHLDILPGGKWEVRRESGGGDEDLLDDLSC